MAFKITPKSIKTFKISPKRRPKSMKNLGCVADAFSERLLGGLGAENGQRRCYGEGHFGSHFRPKIEKRHQKKHAKLDAEKVLKISGKRLPK